MEVDFSAALNAFSTGNGADVVGDVLSLVSTSHCLPAAAGPDLADSDVVDFFGDLNSSIRSQLVLDIVACNSAHEDIHVVNGQCNHSHSQS